MILLENLKMAFRSLANAKLRTLLTMLGIVIGVAAVVAILAIGAGVKKSIESQITGVVNTHAIAVASGIINPSTVRGGGSASAALGASTLTEADIVALKKVDNIEAVAPLSLISGNVAHNSVPYPAALLLATEPEYIKTQSLDFAAGRFLRDDDTGQNVAVLGGNAKRALFGHGEAVGKVITIRGAKFTVVGAIQGSDAASSGLSGGGFDDAVYIPMGTAAKLIGSQPPIVRILAQTSESSRVNDVAANMKQALLKTHDGQEDFTVLTQKDLLETTDSVLSLLTSFIVAIAAISLLVGGIGIMNIMLVSVTERTREIGLRKAIGASSFTVLSQFLIEAMVLSLLGGVLGIAAAIGIANLAGAFAKITPVFTIQAMILAVGVSAAVGIIFGIAPAIKAARKRPIQALKAE
jgi:putative ABC transport system permease protein